MATFTVGLAERVLWKTEATNAAGKARATVFILLTKCYLWNTEAGWPTDESSATVLFALAIIDLRDTDTSSAASEVRRALVVRSAPGKVQDALLTFAAEPQRTAGLANCTATVIFASKILGYTETRRATEKPSAAVCVKLTQSAAWNTLVGRSTDEAIGALSVALTVSRNRHADASGTTAKTSPAALVVLAGSKLWNTEVGWTTNETVLAATVVVAGGSDTEPVRATDKSTIAIIVCDARKTNVNAKSQRATDEAERAIAWNGAGCASSRNADTPRTTNKAIAAIRIGPAEQGVFDTDPERAANEADCAISTYEAWVAILVQSTVVGGIRGTDTKRPANLAKTAVLIVLAQGRAIWNADSERAAHTSDATVATCSARIGAFRDTHAGWAADEPDAAVDIRSALGVRNADTIRNAGSGWATFKTWRAVAFDSATGTTSRDADSKGTADEAEVTVFVCGTQGRAIRNTDTGRATDLTNSANLSSSPACRLTTRNALLARPADESSSAVLVDSAAAAGIQDTSAEWPADKAEVALPVCVTE
ncbi:unnamed protein product [Clonostachys byssicola]|uniref:Uncharacterized protein n=1 Tax=Clonostachys byssicola TaxID=160290 RepID=A0A9N9U4L3_9HYPO|nr:unnamed protein product [Clonostachys byssicola]